MLERWNTKDEYIIHHENDYTIDWIRCKTIQAKKYHHL